MVLFDEVEKAHPDVLTIMLQLFDEVDWLGLVYSKLQWYSFHALHRVWNQTLRSRQFNGLNKILDLQFPLLYLYLYGI